MSEDIPPTPPSMRQRQLFDRALKNDFGVRLTDGEIGLAIREGRERLGMTQSAIAKQAGVGRRLISDIENGKLNLRLGELMAVSGALGLELRGHMTFEGGRLYAPPKNRQ